MWRGTCGQLLRCGHRPAAGQRVGGDHPRRPPSQRRHVRPSVHRHAVWREGGDQTRAARLAVPPAAARGQHVPHPGGRAGHPAGALVRHSRALLQRAGPAAARAQRLRPVRSVSSPAVGEDGAAARRPTAQHHRVRPQPQGGASRPQSQQPDDGARRARPPAVPRRLRAGEAVSRRAVLRARRPPTLPGDAPARRHHPLRQRARAQGRGGGGVARRPGVHRLHLHLPAGRPAAVAGPAGGHRRREGAADRPDEGQHPAGGHLRRRARRVPLVPRLRALPEAVRAARLHGREGDAARAGGEPRLPVRLAVRLDGHGGRDGDDGDDGHDGHDGHDGQTRRAHQDAHRIGRLGDLCRRGRGGLRRLCPVTSRGVN